MDEGLIRSESLGSGRRGRPPLVFHPVHDVASSTVARARVEGAISRGRMLRAMSREPPSGLEADALRQVDVLYEHLDDAGLNPVVDEKYLRFELTPCRYHDLLDADQELVCGVHAQLVRDVLRQSDGPLEVKRLEPFVTPHTCRLLLTRGAPRAGERDE
jgi:predicted ArsR family transcriptional regulator